jgi:membrane protein
MSADEQHLVVHRIPVYRALNIVRQFIPQLMREFIDRGCQQQAAALTYMTLFAVVPTMTVVFTMFSLFPAFEGMSTQLESFLFSYLLPDAGLNVEFQLKTFTEQARSLTLAGVGMLLVTAYLMIKNIESTFNRIWGVAEARRGLNNFLLYWAILSLGPLLLGAGIAVSTYLLSLRFFSNNYDPTGIVPLVLRYSPWLLTTAAFTLLFAAVPNCKVPLRNAFIGGFLTAICFELFKDLFGLLVANTPYTTVYGTFAMVPLFLLWVYILWVIVLSGAVLVYTLTAFKAARATAQVDYPDLLAALLSLWRFRQCQQTGRGVKDSDLQQDGVGADQWLQIRETLIQQRVIAVTVNDEYVLCRDLSNLTLGQLADMVGIKPYLPQGDLAQDKHQLQALAGFAKVTSHLSSLDERVAEAFEVSLDVLFDDGAVAETPQPKATD